MINISKKIEAVRNQPEHIRIWYVWGCVAISMVLVLIVWIFSITSMFAEERQANNEIVPDMNEQLQTIKEQSSILEDFSAQSFVGNNNSDTTASQDTDGSIENATDTSGASNTIESSRYSDLPDTNSSQ